MKLKPAGGSEARRESEREAGKRARCDTVHKGTETVKKRKLKIETSPAWWGHGENQRWSNRPGDGKTAEGKEGERKGEREKQRQREREV